MLHSVVRYNFCVLKNQITILLRTLSKEIGMETTVRVNKSIHERVVDENSVRVPMFLTGQFKAFGRLIDRIN